MLSIWRSPPLNWPARAVRLAARWRKIEKIDSSATVAPIDKFSSTVRLSKIG